MNNAMQINQKDPILKRTLLLAFLELYQRMKALNLINNLENKKFILNGWFLFVFGKKFLFLDTPLNYIQVFLKEHYTKPFCFVDLDLYFGLLLNSEIQQLLDFLNTINPTLTVKMY